MDQKDNQGTRLGAELERLALTAAADDYDQINYQLFGDSLARPTLAWSDSRATLGCWTAVPPGIQLSRCLLTDYPWLTLLEVLKHEMAHQYVSEVLCCDDETAHGPAFNRVCAERGIDARAAGRVEVTMHAADHTLDKIRGLFALAESSNQNEAEAAMAAAQRLMLKYNLEQVNRKSQRDFVVAHLGVPTGRVQESARLLAGILRNFFFVETLWMSVWRPQDAKRGTVLEVCGTQANVDMAEYVYAFLTESSERLWREHKRRSGIRHNRDRRRFLAGVMTGFFKKLDSERAPRQREGLVWVEDPQLGAHFRNRHPRVRSVSYATSHGTEAHAQGREAGQRLVLHRGIQAGHSNVAKLLGS